jgi:hypothetical protein
MSKALLKHALLLTHLHGLALCHDPHQLLQQCVIGLCS